MKRIIIALTAINIATTIILLVSKRVRDAVIPAITGGLITGDEWKAEWDTLRGGQQ